jgi:putative phosphoribosyl transferase
MRPPGRPGDDRPMRFRDRRQAGRTLAVQLAGLRLERPIVIALPRGGVPVAYEIAKALDAPLDILAVRKIGAPGNPEFGVGAIAEDGTAVLDQRNARRAGMTQDLLDQTVQREVRELRRRVEAYRDGRAPIDVRGRTVVIVDDGLATGLADLAGIRALRARGAARIVVAVPVGSRESIALIKREADEVSFLTVPSELRGVGLWYEDFSPVSDKEVTTLLARAASGDHPEVDDVIRSMTFVVGDARLGGDLTVPERAKGLVLFAHGSGSSRHSPRNRTVARALNEAGLATLLFDLLTEREAARRELVFDSPLLADRLVAVTNWAAAEAATRHLPVGYFGASTGAAAALRAAARLGDRVKAVVSRGGRADLAGDLLPRVTAPTLLIVGSRDRDVLELNRRAAQQLRCPYRIAVVEGAGHLFEEPGTLEAVTQLAAEWFEAHLATLAPPLAATAG